MRRRWRVWRNLREGPDLKGDAALAGRHLFGLLAELEEIAVLAARRGRGVRGQLADEIVHRDTFAALADRLGGAPPCPAAVGRLFGFLANLEGTPAATAVLNVVAESWLETVFRHLGQWGVAPRLLARIEAEEARHVQLACRNNLNGTAELRNGAGLDFQKLVQEAEHRLIEVALSGAFLIPMYHFGGRRGVARLGLDAIRRHRAACRRLGIEPGPTLELFRRSCLAGLLVGDPEPACHSAWDDQRSWLWDGFAPMRGAVTVPFRPIVPRGTSRARLAEAAVAWAWGRLLARSPRLHRVYRNRRIFHPAPPIVGIRRSWGRANGRRLITTVHVGSPQRRSLVPLAAEIERRLGLQREHPYVAFDPVEPELWRLAPPARSAVTVSYNGATGGHPHWDAPVEIEGPMATCVIGDENDGRLTLGVQVDHRAVDGADARSFYGALARGVEEATGGAGC